MSKLVRYILIDDEEPGTAKGLAENFTYAEKIKTCYLPPLPWSEQRKSFELIFSNEGRTVGEILDDLSREEETNSYNRIQVKEWVQNLVNCFAFNSDDTLCINGLILDWKLDEKIPTTNYKGSSVAQEIRNMATGNVIKNIPLILFSAPDVLSNFYDTDNTSHDLFDLKISKISVGDRRKTKRYHDLLISYNQVYELLENGNKNVHDLLCLQDDSDLDERVLDYFLYLKNKNSPSHEYVQYTKKYIISKPGVLIDEFLLAARLGINIYDEKNLNESWNKFKYEVLGHLVYKGIFSTSYPRWWAKGLKKWMRKEKINPRNLNKKIEILNEKYDINLIPAEKTDKSRSTDFWAVCKKSNRPIAIEDGILAYSSPLSPPWQEDEYYCIDVAINLDKSKIHPMDRVRWQKLKRLHAPRRQ